MPAKLMLYCCFSAIVGGVLAALWIFNIPSISAGKMGHGAVIQHEKLEFPLRACLPIAVGMTVPGMDKNEVLKLFGPPDFNRKENYYYYIINEDPKFKSLKVGEAGLVCFSFKHNKLTNSSLSGLFLKQEFSSKMRGDE